ncbi:hypothetical protein SAMN02745133_01926 [Desulforamulus putei DSM 12395]|uniref:Uncharacterized protein n=1 Tax=Desulforamulus putei DSM 12395 TaxID=1121429 RepID=A0A1M4Z9Z9_9FIRM|nr:hypothetical protein [Desulforamulus putei]SHF14861.1 hypothetical protein SAMN02745133_01926 [Desulforamulus putei DSM 12395]
MKSIFLYEQDWRKISNNASPGIYNFNCCNLVGIDTLKIEKKERISLVKSVGLREVHILQRWFAELIIHAPKLGIFIKKVNLTNLNDQSEEICDINNFIETRNYTGLLDYIIELNQEYGTEIKSIVFVYRNVEFKITSTGVLETYSTEQDFQRLLSDNLLWPVIVGQSRYLQEGLNENT